MVILERDRFLNFFPNGRNPFSLRCIIRYNKAKKLHGAANQTAIDYDLNSSSQQMPKNVVKNCRLTMCVSCQVG